MQSFAKFNPSEKPRRPKSMRVTQQADGEIELVYKWAADKPMAFACLVGVIVSLTWMMSVSDLTFKLMGFFPLVFSSLLLARSLIGLVSKTIITISQHRLSVRHPPLSWVYWGHSSLRESISKLCYWQREQPDGYITTILFFQNKDGGERLLLRNLSPAEAKYAGWFLATALELEIKQSRLTTVVN